MPSKKKGQEKSESPVVRRKYTVNPLLSSGRKLAAAVRERDGLLSIKIRLEARLAECDARLEQANAAMAEAKAEFDTAVSAN